MLHHPQRLKMKWNGFRSRTIPSSPPGTSSVAGDGGGASLSSTIRMLKNLLGWDGASRIYFWDSVVQCLHRISIRLSELDPASVLADSPS